MFFFDYVKNVAQLTSNTSELLINSNILGALICGNLHETLRTLPLGNNL